MKNIPKLGTIRAKVERINEQITEAQTEFDGLTGEIKAIEDELTKELGKVKADEARIDQLEADRENFVKIQARLTARVAALQETLPDNEKLIAQAELRGAIKEHDAAIDQVNEALESYRTEGLQLLRTFVGIYHSLIDKRLVAEGLRDKVAYFSELLELERPKLKTANSLTHEEDTDLSREIHNCIPMRADPYRTSEYSEKLRVLQQEAHDKKAAEAAVRNKAEAKAQGW